VSSGVNYFVDSIFYPYRKKSLTRDCGYKNSQQTFEHLNVSASRPNSVAVLKISGGDSASRCCGCHRRGLCTTNGTLQLSVTSRLPTVWLFWASCMTEDAWEKIKNMRAVLIFSRPTILTCSQHLYTSAWLLRDQLDPPMMTNSLRNSFTGSLQCRVMFSRRIISDFFFQWRKVLLVLKITSLYPDYMHYMLQVTINHGAVTREINVGLHKYSTENPA